MQNELKKSSASRLRRSWKDGIEMTFEEAIEVSKVISTLKETYAPKIKMTSEQKDELMLIFLFRCHLDFWCIGFF